MNIALRRRLPLAVALILASTSLANANVKLAAVFGDHMVLQAGKPVTVWGTASPDESITVDLAGQSKSIAAGADGAWKVTFDALSAGNAISLTVTGKNKTALSDILVGEVWLCSGQSNMVLPVSKAADFDHEKTIADQPVIRVFTTKWVVCTPQTVGTFSAVAYFFGRELQKKLNVPIGLVVRAAGGSPIEWWTAKAAQESVPELKAMLDQPQAAQSTDPQAEIDRKQAIAVEGKNAAGAAKHPPGQLFDDRIAPLMPMSIRGIVWYQGEANSYTANAYLYGLQLKTMILDWRKGWGEDLPFVTVQLPELGKPQSDPVEASGRALVRDGVLQSLKLPHVGMAVTLGTGEANNNHPKNKQEVGRRLARWALREVYDHEDTESSGPVPAGHQINGDKIVITFDHADGLTTNAGAVKALAIRGSDGQWVWADSKIDGNTLVVWSDKVKAPTAVRYAWAGNPAGANLTNTAGLPATPFATDDAAAPVK